MSQELLEQTHIERTLFDLQSCVCELNTLKNFMSKQDIDYLNGIGSQIKQNFIGGNNGIA